MDNSEVQKILDKGAIPFAKFNRGIHCNVLLSEEQVQTLYDIVAECESKSSNNRGKSDFNYEAALDKVADIINSNPSMRDFDLDYTGVPLVSMEMPFLIKQVLFYLYYKMKSDRRYREGTIERFLYDLEKRGVSKTKKFLDVGGLTPEKYYQMKKYIQPKNPCPYKGQKNWELAEAIKNLAYQAGKYSYYVDLFGGSGSATTALFPQDKVKQVYNEKNRTIYNYFEVISSDRYEELQKAIDIVQEDLSQPDYEINPYFGFDIPEVLRKYINEMYHNDKGMINASPEEKIYNYYGCNLRFYDEDKEEYMITFSDLLNKEFPEGKNFGDYSYSDMLEWKSKEDFDKYFEVIKNIEDEYVKGVSLLGNAPYRYGRYNFLQGDVIKDNKVVETNVDYERHKYNIGQLKMLAYFAYFKNLYNKSEIKEEEKVKCAVAAIYLQRYATRGDIINSSILTCTDDVSKWVKVSNKFINMNLENCIENFHSRVRRCYNQDLLRNCDFEDVINEFADKSENVLFYADSPYIGTSDYGDKVNSVDDFTTEDMDRLIKSLMESNKKFIFSMRAVISGGDDNNKIKGNNQLKEHVYEQFDRLSKPSKPLYVLVILRQDWILEDAIKAAKEIEIMITNFPIVSFDNYKKGKNAKRDIYKYEVYKFKDFKKIVEDNMPCQRGIS